MRKLVIAAALAALLLPPSSRAQGLKEVEGSFLEPLQQRDSILVADQLRYGFTLEDVAEGTELRMQDYSQAFGDTLVVVRNWKADTLKTVRKGRKGPARYSLRWDVVLAPFEAGTYHLPYILGILLLGFLAWIIWKLVARRRKDEADLHRDPPYIVALKRLENYRSEKYWAPDKQKAFYSGITDTLREYIAGTFGIDACEMTTAEIFDALKDDRRLTPELHGSTRELFELADYVKFAKHIASDAENAAALPQSVRFVTSTYQTTLEEETSGTGKEKEAE